MGQPANPLVTSDFTPTDAARARWYHLADEKVATHAELALFPGGSADSFTGLLPNLMGKADLGNMARLAGAFPRQAIIWYIWRNLDPAPTYAQLQTLSDIMGS